MSSSRPSRSSSHPSLKASSVPPSASRHAPSARSLVLSLLPPLSSDPTTLSLLTDHITQLLQSDPYALPRLEMRDVHLKLGGMERTARVRVEQGLAEGLEKVRQELGRRWDRVYGGRGGIGAGVGRGHEGREDGGRRGGGDQGRGGQGTVEGEGRGWDEAWDYDPVPVSPEEGGEGAEEEANLGGTRRQVVRMQNIPQHVQFLLALAQPATSRTHRFAADYLARESLPPRDEQRELFDEIMAAPFESAHWGPSYVYRERDEDWELSSDPEHGLASDASESSAEEEELVTPLRRAGVFSSADLRRQEEQTKAAEAEARLRDAQATLRRLKDGAYWSTGGREVDVQSLKAELDGQKRPDGWRETTARLTSLGLALRLPGSMTGGDTSNPIKRGKMRVVSDTELQRELVYALSGREGAFFVFAKESGACEIKKGIPAVPSRTPMALADTLRRYAELATRAEQVRRFCTTALQPPTHDASAAQKAASHTIQAFAVGCRDLMAGYDTYLAALEHALISGVITDTATADVATPLRLRLAVETRYGEMLSLLHSLLPLVESPHDLLDALYNLLTSPTPSTGATPPTELSASPVNTILLDLFTRTATPLWTAFSQWLSHGIPLPIAYTSLESYLFASSPSPNHGEAGDDEESIAPWAAEWNFPIVRDRDSDWTDEDFWESGWVARDWPGWIPLVLKEGVLEAGKARGLLRGLGGEEGSASGIGEWISLREVLLRSGISQRPEGQQLPTSFDKESADRAMRDFLDPICRIPTFQLRRVLKEDCGLEAHLEAIDGVFFMTAHKVWDDWTSWLFEQIHAGKKWQDFQTLTSTFRDMAESMGEHWVNAPAVRITVDRPPHRQTRATVESLASLRVTYDVPFPLSQLFTSTSLELRAEAFGLLLQIRYAQHLLSRLAARLARLARTPTDPDEWGTIQHHTLLIRQRVSYIFNSISSWLADRILLPQTAKYAERLEDMSGLGEMIQAELAHTRLIRDFSLAHERTGDIRRAVGELIRVVQELWDHSAVPVHPPPSSDPAARGLRRTRRSSDESDTEDDHKSPPSPDSDASPQGNTGVSSLNLASVMGMSAEVDQLIGQLRAGIEELAAQTEQKEVEREGWEMLAFALKG